jgi:hypothetical protein
MKRKHDDPPRFNPAGLATGCILALIIAMAISVAFDIQPAEASGIATMVQTGSDRA